MNLQKAYKILDIDRDAEFALIKANYRWLIKFYHPDCGQYPSHEKTIEVINAFVLIKKY